MKPLRLGPDTRSQRWKDAEARCTAGEAPPDALAIIAEEQAYWDAAFEDGRVAGRAEKHKEIVAWFRSCPLNHHMREFADRIERGDTDK